MYKRIVVKVGTNLLTDTKGFNKGFLKSLVRQLSNLHTRGKEIILVSSGAIGCGAHRMGFSAKPTALSEKQATAAIGQIMLMQAYETAFSEKGIIVAQVLLGHDDIKNKARNVNSRNTLNTLLGWKTIPIVNENDTVATDEIKFGDNDTLAGIVGSLVSADIVIILTSVDGIYDKNPDDNPDAKIIPDISDIHEAIGNIKTDGKTSLGTGGMVTKLEIARKLNLVGIPLVIANGNRENVIENIVAGKKEGTIVREKNGKVDSKKRYILMSLKVKGEIKVDDGARNVLLNAGKSLLAVGITHATGDFAFGDAVEIVDSRGRKIGKGITNYSSKQLIILKGKKNAEIQRMGLDNYYEEVIHRDNLTVYK
ncbi:MAG: glutamate 5-kinase [Spirochaetia bacterium]|nr:glutamate 5-kinase [Spirochaetia bacterium]